MAKLNWSTTNTQITDEIINVSDSSAIGLLHDIFYNKTGKLVVISTGSGGGGTVLTETTDYTIGGALSDSKLPASITPDVAYTTVAITNATYHSTDLYVSYYPLGDFVEAEDVYSALGHDSAWTTETSLINGWTGTLHYIKRAGVVTLNFTSLNNSSETSNALYTMPAGYRPAIQVHAVCTDFGSLNTHPLTLTTGGSLLITGGSDINIRGLVSYPII